MNFALAIIAVIALCIYNGQLNVMRGQLAQMIRSSTQTDKLILEAQRQNTFLRQQLVGTRLCVVALYTSERPEHETRISALTNLQHGEYELRTCARARRGSDAYRLNTSSIELRVLDATLGKFLGIEKQHLFVINRESYRPR